MKIKIMTIFPQMFAGFLNTSIIKRAIDNKLIEIEIVDFRQYSKDKNKRVDDYPYGGGAGMILSCQPVLDCLSAIKSDNSFVIITDPAGKRFDQSLAKQYSQKDELVITWPEPLDMLSVNNKDGKVIVTDIEAEEFRITTEEGAIECAGLTGNYGELRSAMGALKLESSDFMNLFMETEMGKLTAAGVSSERYHLVTELGK